MSDDKAKLDLEDLGADGRGTLPDVAQPPETPYPTSSEKLAGAHEGQEDLGAVYDIPVQLSAVLGKTTMPVSQLLRLGRGAVVELDRKVGESIDILVNNRLVARGEVVILDGRLGVTMTEIIKTEP